MYVKEPYDHVNGSGSNGWDTLAKKWNKNFFTSTSALSSTDPSSQILTMQKEVYKSIHWWREKIAREEDESTRYVMPNQYLFKIAEAPPGDLMALLKVFGAQVPVVVKRRQKELLDVVRDAVRAGLLEGRSVEGKEGKEVRKERVGEQVNEEEKEVQGEQQAEQRVVKEAASEKLWGMLILPSIFPSNDI